MRHCSPFAKSIPAILFGAFPLVCQQPARQASDPVIRVTVGLVQVDAVVTDSRGRHVVDLTRDDFEVLEDGRAQKITRFSNVQGAALQALATSVPSTDTAPAEVIPRPPAALRQDQVHRTIVLIADDLGLASNDIPLVRRAMKNFVDRKMQMGDLVSIVTTSGGAGVAEQLTNDKRQLYASIDRIHWSPSRTALTWYEPVRRIDRFNNIDNASNRRLNAVRNPHLATATEGALAYVIQGLREMPGRKAIVLFSNGFNQEVDGIVELANRASVVIYTIDARGLVSFFLTAADACRPPRCNVRLEEGKRQSAFRASQKSLDLLARGTAGIFFHDDNDLDRGLSNAVDDMDSYYLLGYQPQREDFDRVRGNARFHRIEVKVLRPGLQVRSRNGFIGTPDAPPAAHAESAQEQLRRALLSPFQANGFQVQLSAFYSASAEKEPKTGRRSTLLRGMLAIDAHGLKFKDVPDGKKELNIEVVAAVYGANSEVIASSDKKFGTVMSPAEMTQIVASGVVYGIDIAIPKPGPYQLRVAVLDANSEQLGSASTFVEIPDFNRSAIALSSVLLYDSDSKRNEQLTRAGVIGAGSPVTRAFVPGAAIVYDCTVFGTLLDKQTAKPQIDIEVRLLRGPEQIFTGKPLPLDIGEEGSRSAIHAMGEIKLPGTLPPGNYALELSVYARLEKAKLQRAVQWADFTLVRPD